MFLPNDKTALCSGQPWKSCRQLGSTPGLPAASLPAAHPRAAAAVRGPRRPSRFRGPGTRRARGTVPPPPGGARRHPRPRQEERRGRAKKRKGAARWGRDSLRPALAAPRPRPVLLGSAVAPPRVGGKETRFQPPAPAGPPGSRGVGSAPSAVAGAARRPAPAPRAPAPGALPGEPPRPSRSFAAGASGRCAFRAGRSRVN